MVRETGIEPVRVISPQDFKSCASACSATRARFLCTKNIIAFSMLFVNKKITFFEIFVEKLCKTRYNGIGNKYYRRLWYVINSKND